MHKIILLTVLLLVSTEPCPVKDYPLHSGLESLAGVGDCEGSLGYTEDKYHYGYMWNITQSQNLSWRFYSDSQTGRYCPYTRLVYVYDGNRFNGNLRF